MAPRTPANGLINNGLGNGMMINNKVNNNGGGMYNNGA